MQQFNSSIEGNILYDPSRFDKPEQQLFEPEYWLARNTTSAVNGGRGQVLFIRDSGHAWVLRHYRRGGVVAIFNNDIYLWQGAEATRSFCEWRLLARLVELQLPVPSPVAARYLRVCAGLGYRADLITREIGGARSLAAVLKVQPLASDQWQSIGTTLARFHRHGVRHADLNAHNIVFDALQKIHLLDFDRGQISRPHRHWINQVLARLLRSLSKLKLQQAIHFTDDDWQQLLQAHDTQFNQARE